jgi:hypothetical protein
LTGPDKLLGFHRPKNKGPPYAYAMLYILLQKYTMLYSQAIFALVRNRRQIDGAFLDGPFPAASTISNQRVYMKHMKDERNELIIPTGNSTREGV